MAKPRVGVISYGSRGAAVADAFYRSPEKPEVYIASKQANPMNIRIGLPNVLNPGLTLSFHILRKWDGRDL